MSWNRLVLRCQIGQGAVAVLETSLRGRSRYRAHANRGLAHRHEFAPQLRTLKRIMADAPNGRLKQRQNSLTQATTLRALLQREGCLTLPGLSLTASRRAWRTGFNRFYTTGYGVVASAVGRRRCRRQDPRHGRCSSRDFPIVARTDARYAEGLDAALRRAERFLEAGADVLFVESPESPGELRRVAGVQELQIRKRHQNQYLESGSRQ